MEKLAPYLKALTAALVALCGALAVALEDGSINAQEGATCAGAFLAALAAVWAIPNQPQ